MAYNEQKKPIPVVEGGTGATTQAGARTNLGLGTLATQNGTFSGNSSGTNTGDQDLSGLMVKANNLSDISSAKISRANLGVDKRTAFGNADYTILSTDKEVVTSATLTAPRVVTLPAASSMNPGAEVIVSDEFGAINGSNTLSIVRAGSDTINGTTSETIGSQYGMRRLFTDGVSKWTFDKGVLRSSQNLSDVANATTSRNNLGAASLQSAVLTATQDNSTVTPAVLTGHTFTIPPGKTATIQGTLVFTAAAITTGGSYGIRVAQEAAADGNAQGSSFITVNLASTAAATGLSDGDSFNVAGGASSFFEVLGTATTAGNNAAFMNAVIRNQSTNKTVTVTLEFRSEVAASLVQAQIGTSATCVIS